MPQAFGGRASRWQARSQSCQGSGIAASLCRPQRTSVYFTVKHFHSTAARQPLNLYNPLHRRYDSHRDYQECCRLVWRATEYVYWRRSGPAIAVPDTDNHCTEATREEMSAARLPLAYRDSCAHLLIPLNRCRREEYYLPWKCEVRTSITNAARL